MGDGVTMTNIAVLGTGTGASGASSRLTLEGSRPFPYDKNSCSGGYATFFMRGGFVFDVGPYISRCAAAAR